MPPETAAQLATPDPRPGVIVVDDEVAHLQALTDRLRTDGYRVWACGAAEQALALLADGQAADADLLLTDLRMPGIDGMGLLEQVRLSHPEIVAVLMTGHASIESAVAALQSGAFDYVVKPFRMATIRPVLARALETRRLRRQAAVLQRSLADRQARLEAANRELDAFAGRVAHDLRAPIHHMVGYAELLQPFVEGDGEARHYLTRLTEAGLRAEQIVEDLLRFARLADGPLQRAPVPLQRVVSSVCAAMAAQPAGNARVQWRVGDLPVVLGDESLLGIVFTNLISNALKFSARRETPLIEIGGAAGEGMCTVWVRDNGVGFDPAQAQRLFAAFERLHTQREFPGTGLGLCNVRRIVERHGGSIRAAAQPGQGACFTLELPGAASPLP